MKNLDSKRESIFALDATAFYQGFHLHSSSTCITTEMVYNEISHIQNKFSILESLISNKRLKIAESSKKTIKLVQNIAKKIGESRLSTADVSIIALAKDYNAILVTDDFAICNLVNAMSIPLLNLGTRGIEETRKWIKFCKSCGKGYPPTLTLCPICGNELRVRYKKIKTLKDKFKSNESMYQNQKSY